MFLKLLGLRLGILLLIYSIFRVVFWLLNLRFFPDTPFIAFVAGIRFDLAALMWLNIPVVILHILPLPWRSHAAYRGFLKTVFYFCNIPGYVLACGDMVYFSFTHKRSTSDLLDILMLGDDAQTLLPVFLRDYWYIFLLFAVMVFATEYLYKQTQKVSIAFKLEWRNLPLQLIFGVLAIALWVIMGRGGLQYAPIKMINAGNYVRPDHVPVVLNTPFTVMQTLNKQRLDELTYFSTAELDERYTTTRQYPKGTLTIDQPNVVLILMESFSSEYIGSISGQESYTPFLDSLFDHGLLFTNAFSNGHRSIEALPSIISSIPQLMNDAFVASNYSSNTISGLPMVLKPNGYHCSFYHGGKNGTMAFDSYCDAAGFDEYKGMTEYPYEDDYDGNWGIFDEPYFQYFAQELNETEQPFFSAIFSLSSHHPYTVPEKYKGRFKEGSLPIHRTTQYADLALQRFFKTAATMPWYENTLFVITADHTGHHDSDWYNNAMGSFSVPIFLFRPGSMMQGREDRIMQHIDIMPTVLDLLGYEAPFFSFGTSLFSEPDDRWAVGYINQVYQLVQGDRVLLYDGERSVGLYATDDRHWQEDLSTMEPARKTIMENQVKAIVQRYNQAMIYNQLTLE